MALEQTTTEHSPKPAPERTVRSATARVRANFQQKIMRVLSGQVSGGESWVPDRALPSVGAVWDDIQFISHFASFSKTHHVEYLPFRDHAFSFFLSFVSQAISFFA